MPWDTSAQRHDRYDARAEAARPALRRRSGGRCEWAHATLTLPWINATSDPCRSYGVAAVRLHDDADNPAAWAWLCGDHATRVRAGT